jgi:hypothetical protein
VPDGSDLYVPSEEDLADKYKVVEVNEDYLVDHLLLRFNSHTSQGHGYFKRNEGLNNSDVKKMSKLSTYLSSQVKFRHTKEKRRKNFEFLHKALESSNNLKFKSNDDISSNFYPYLPAEKIEKQLFWQNNVFVPILWRDCIQRETQKDFSLEKNLSENLLPLPVDHRYNTRDMKTILKIIDKHNERTS